MVLVEGHDIAMHIETHAMNEFLSLRILLFNSKIEITKVIAFRKKKKVSKSNVRPNVQNC